MTFFFCGRLPSMCPRGPSNINHRSHALFNREWQMKTQKHRIALVLFAVVSLSTIAFAQPDPDASLWGGGVANPSGDIAVPVVAYEPLTGLMFLNSAGLNGIVDTTTGTLIGVDDVGAISLSVLGPQADQVLLNGFINQNIGGVVVNGIYTSGKQQLAGVAAGAEYLEPTDRIDVFQYTAGLTAEDFGGDSTVDPLLGGVDGVEIGVNFALGTPGNTLFGRVQFVPEPTSFWNDTTGFARPDGMVPSPQLNQRLERFET